MVSDAAAILVSMLAQVFWEVVTKVRLEGKRVIPWKTCEGCRGGSRSGGREHQTMMLVWGLWRMGEEGGLGRKSLRLECSSDVAYMWNLKKWYKWTYLQNRNRLSSVQFSCSVVSNSLQPHESQHARPPCPSPTPGVHPDSRPSSQGCHPAISSSVVPFSSQT